MTETNLEVRGYSSFNRPASSTIKVFATLVDICIIFGLEALILRLLHISPAPGVLLITGTFLLASLYWYPQKHFFKITLGQRFWQLRPGQRGLHQNDYFSPGQVFKAALLSTVLFLTSLTLLQTSVFHHPIWLRGTEWQFEPFTPSSSEWSVLPFFYSLGAAPKTFDGDPIPYSVRYEKGPPSRFVGHIVAEWKSPDIKWIIEGPKTPKSDLDLGQLKECILNSLSFACLHAKDEVLSRHIQEMSSWAGSSQNWGLHWLSILHAELVEGIHLSIETGDMIQDRFILINAFGKHQAFILSRPKSPLGNQAFELALKSIRSLSIFPDLDTGRAWIDRVLGGIRLKELENTNDPNVRQVQLLDVQRLLISRISVDPGSLDTYFHLAGNSLMLSQRKGPSMKSALQNLSSSYLYAQDIAPVDSRTEQIHQILLKVKKLNN